MNNDDAELKFIDYQSCMSGLSCVVIVMK